MYPPIGLMTHCAAVGAIHNLWLAARAHHVGLEWVSILDPAAVTETLSVPETWQFVGYLCLGYPLEEHVDAELHRAGWQKSLSHRKFVFER